MAPGEIPAMVGLTSHGDRRHKVRRLANHHLHVALIGNLFFALLSQRKCLRLGTCFGKLDHVEIFFKTGFGECSLGSIWRRSF